MNSSRIVWRTVLTGLAGLVFGDVAVGIAALAAPVTRATPAVGLTQKIGPKTGQKTAKSPAPSDAQSDAQRTSRRRALPRLVDRAVRRNAAQRSGQPLSQLYVSDYQAEVWPDGCLGLGADGESCSQSLVSGWWVRVSETLDETLDETSGEPLDEPSDENWEGGARTWVYRSNASGRTIRLESADKLCRNVKFDTPRTELQCWDSPKSKSLGL